MKFNPDRAFRFTRQEIVGEESMAISRTSYACQRSSHQLVTDRAYILTHEGNAVLRPFDKKLPFDR